MTREQKAQIDALRGQGVAYAEIAEQLGLPKNTVKTYCWRCGAASRALEQVSEQAAEPVPEQTPEPAPDAVCPYCGRLLRQRVGKRPRRFCSDACRVAWWATHRDQLKPHAQIQIICAACGKAFTGYTGQARKYCTHGCYIMDRFGGTRQHDERAI